MGERDLYRVRRKFGVLFQDGALFGSMNMFDNMAFPLREHTKKSEKEIREIVLAKADMVGMLDHMKKFPGEVSGGMKKRAGLARALAMDPEIILFDEPDSGLDPVRVSYLDELVKKIQEETGATFVIITHNIASVMRIVRLHRRALPRRAGEVRQQAGDAHHRRRDHPPVPRRPGARARSAWTSWPPSRATSSATWSRARWRAWRRRAWTRRTPPTSCRSDAG